MALRGGNFFLQIFLATSCACSLFSTEFHRSVGAKARHLLWLRQCLCTENVAYSDGGLGPRSSLCCTSSRLVATRCHRPRHWCLRFAQPGTDPTLLLLVRKGREHCLQHLLRLMPAQSAVLQPAQLTPDQWTYATHLLWYSLLVAVSTAYTVLTVAYPGD